MVLARPSPPLSSSSQAPPDRVVWHDLECGAYRADMEFWREFARRSARPGEPNPILDVGAGTGRVSLELAREGHQLCALDLDQQLLDALEERAAIVRGEASAGFELETVCADARTFALARRDFALCVVPMQTIQLLGGAQQRREFLRRARAHLRPGGLLACAIVTDVEPFDCGGGDIGPSAERTSIAGTLFVSRAVRVRVRRQVIRIERERRIIHPGRAPGAPPPQSTGDVIELDRLNAARLQKDALSVGFSAREVHSLGATAEHVGSLVVVLGA